MSARRATRAALTAIVFASAATAVQAQNTQIRGFADVTMRASDGRQDHSTFTLGQLDLYITSALGNQLSFLAETVFEFDDASEEFASDVERVVVSYAPRPYFRVAAGKHHTPIGYWNTAYHHGALMQPTIERPFAVRFEDDGGLMPIHTVGLLISGRDISRAHLLYDVMVGNGIGGTPDSDNNDKKSVTLSLGSQITSELSVGASLYRDQAPAGTTALDGSELGEDLTQSIASTYVAYFGSRLELIGELHHLRDEIGTTDAGSNLYFVYAGVRFNRLVPYVRIDRLAVANGDPYLGDGGARQGLVGARFDISATSGVRLEVRRRDDQSGRATEAAAQIAIAF
ncbi:MAG TPA: hypothetical protein VFK13_05940 [Gemmatimonadaceae bacterium]|nr:hypothetical protein [Gemmatimonadaceae bacterium]